MREARAAVERVEGVVRVKIDVSLPAAAGASRSVPKPKGAQRAGTVPAPTPAPNLLPTVRRIVAVSSGKGGVGKSTLAGNMVAWLHELGHKVILADCDSQNSSSEWIAEAAPQVRIARYENADEVLEGLPQLRKEADYVVCDGPGSQTETSRALLLWADLAVIPALALIVLNCVWVSLCFGILSTRYRDISPLLFSLV